MAEYLTILFDNIKTPPSCIVQAGVGYASEVHHFKEQWPDTKVIGIEAMGGFVKWWEDNGGYPGELIHAAVSDVAEDVTVFKRGGKLKASSIHERTKGESSPVVVSGITLDSLLETMSPEEKTNVFLWMDCEGSEFKALQGGGEFLKHVEWIVSEVPKNIVTDRPSWPSGEDLNLELKRNGFVKKAVLSSGRSCENILYTKEKS
jgi:FkbM family methyltransferase